MVTTMETSQTGYGVRSIMLANGCYKWESYLYEGAIPHRTYTSCGIFNNKWEAEQYFFNIING
jgi:hypothetical protein